MVRTSEPSAKLLSRLLTKTYSVEPLEDALCRLKVVIYEDLKTTISKSYPEAIIDQILEV